MIAERRSKSDAVSGPPAVAVVNSHFDAEILDPEALIERYHALDGWARALADAGAGLVTVFQRFGGDAVVRRGAIEYRFVGDGHPDATGPWFTGSRLAGAVGAVRPDVVHVHGLIFPVVVRALRLRTEKQTAIVVQDHGGVLWPTRGWRRPARSLLYGFGLHAADGFMFTAREQATPWREAGIIRAPHAIYEVPEASTSLRPASSGATRGLPGKPALLWVGRLDPNKDPLTVLEGFARAAASLPEAALTMVYGDDVMLPEVRDWIAAHPDVAARVHLRGRLDRGALPALYEAADLFVIGSHREVACFSLIEALSFGAAPVVTDIPPFRALTGAGRIGALFAAGDAGACARAIVGIGGDYRAHRPLVRAHFDRALSWPAVGARALEAYRSAVAARRARVGAPWAV